MELFFLQKNHLASERDYFARMNRFKPECMRIAKQFEEHYWDGDRKFGYGGYYFMPGRWREVASKIIERYGLTSDSKVVDIGCGKGFLLQELLEQVPGLCVTGIDVSAYAGSAAPETLQTRIECRDFTKGLPTVSDGFFDLAISLNVFHNFPLPKLVNSISEIMRISRSQYISVESFRDDLELTNLQCWALTCESFFSKHEWEWIFNKFGYNGDYEFIYFT